MLLLATATPLCKAADVKVVANKLSKKVTLVSKETGKEVTMLSQSGDTCSYDASPGKYVITGMSADGNTNNGTIEVTVKDTPDTQIFATITCTVYATNKHEDKTFWTLDKGDFTLNVKVSSREGESFPVTVGKSTTANRNTFLALMGNTYHVEYIPSEQHRAEGYMPCMASGTLNFNVNVSKLIPLGGYTVVTVPKEASLELGTKTSHFIDFTIVAPESEETVGDVRKIRYHLAQGEKYNYRTWMKDGLTQGGYFTFSKDSTKRPDLTFTAENYKAFGPTELKHDVNDNNGYETGDIFLNINERGHLRMNVGDTYKAHAMRTWELTDNSTNNYFIEPDFHYLITDLEGNPCNNVIEITAREGSAWADIKAIGNGSVIVRVIYDAIGVNYFNNNEKKPYMGGEFWSAIWPENTGAFVVTVGGNTSKAVSNMVINEEYNKENLKIAGKYVDAEHDVFYYLDTETGYSYTFKPENVSEVLIAYPTVGDRMADYHGFSSDGVSKNEDGSYTILLKEGRQIVKLTDASGNPVYQIFTAKKCHREITNETRPGSKIFQPGDNIKIQYSGLRHPANKIAGIYNMSAYVTYNGVPNGTSLILGAGQYTFGSVAKAQAVTVAIPDTFDTTSSSQLLMDKGVIQVNGYGDPIGAHRNISPIAGRNPNFTAIAHKTYFGAIPSLIIPISARKNFPIVVTTNVENPQIEVSFNGTLLTPGENGRFSGTYGEYLVCAKKKGYIIAREKFTIDDNAEGLQTFNVNMIYSEKAWDGESLKEPEILDGAYQISNADELAWFAKHVNDGQLDANAVLTDDIELAGYDWTPIATISKPYCGTFNGNLHNINNLYISKPSSTNLALFACTKGTADKHAVVKGIIVNGMVEGKNYSAGIVSRTDAYTDLSQCASYVDVKSSSNYAGGITAYLAATTSSITDCYNTGIVTGNKYIGGIAGSTQNAKITNCYNIGEIVCTGTGSYMGAICGTANTQLSNVYASALYVKNEGYTLVDESQIASGELAYRLGSSFGQEIGKDAHPLLGGKKVYYDADNDRYLNFDPTTGVESVVKDNNAPVFYNLQGISSDKPFPGVNIVRYPDGRVDKIYF